MRPEPSVWQRLARYAAGALPLPPADAPFDRVLYGLAQPVLGLRMLGKDPAIRRAALWPSLLLAAFCALCALGNDGPPPWGFLKSFYTTFALLAPIPSIVLANHYFDLAAVGNDWLGWGPTRPHREPLLTALVHAGKQAVVVAVAVAPALFLLQRLSLPGRVLGAVAASLWALHWIVVEALDGAKLDCPGMSSLPEAPQPWFVRAFAHLASRLPPSVAWLPARFARLCAWLSRPWQEEIAVIEEHPALLCGFALSTAALLCTPVLNLLFRPVIILASVHLLGCLRQETVPAASPGTAG